VELVLDERSGAPRFRSGVPVTPGVGVMGWLFGAPQLVIVSERCIFASRTIQIRRSLSLHPDPGKREREPYCYEGSRFRRCPCGTAAPGGDFFSHIPNEVREPYVLPGFPPLTVRRSQQLYFSPRRHGGTEKRCEENQQSPVSSKVLCPSMSTVAAATKDSSPVRRRGALRALRRKCRVTEKMDTSALPKACA
jgi:hypothetical protein